MHIDYWYMYVSNIAFERCIMNNTYMYEYKNHLCLNIHVYDTYSLSFMLKKQIMLNCKALFWLQVCTLPCVIMPFNKLKTTWFCYNMHCRYTIDPSLSILRSSFQRVSMYSTFKDNVQYLQNNNNNMQKLLWKHSWMVELT